MIVDVTAAGMTVAWACVAFGLAYLWEVRDGQAVALVTAGALTMLGALRAIGAV